MAERPSSPRVHTKGDHVLEMRHDEGSEGAVLNFPNSLFVGPFLDGSRRKEVVCLMEHGD